MTVRAYIPRDASGRERAFKYAHERRAVIELVKGAWKVFRTSPQLYAIVVNVRYPPADTIIVTEDGIGIVEFKDYGGCVQGNEESQWIMTSPTGEMVPIKAGRYPNLFQQVKAYRGQLRSRLERDIQRARVQLPIWLQSKSTYRQATVCFTQQVEKVDCVRKPWFQVTTLDTVHEWISTLVFGEGRRLTKMEVKFITSHILESQEWGEIEKMMPTGITYGYLWVLEGGRKAWRLTLDHGGMRIGRALECGPLMLDESYSSVSRYHAQVRREGDRVVIYDGYRNVSSKNGTFVNGKKVDRIKGHILQDGDTIVLGGYGGVDYNQPPLGVCVLRFHRFKGKSSGPAPTQDYVMERNS